MCKCKCKTALISALCRGRRGESAMCQYTPLYKRGGILHSILHSPLAVPCASALCTLHSRTCAVLPLGRAVGSQGLRGSLLGRVGSRWVGVRVRPSSRVRDRVVDGSHAVRKVCATFCLASAPRACGCVLARPCVHASLHKCRSRARRCENLVKHYASMRFRLIPRAFRVGILPIPRFSRSR